MKIPHNFPIRIYIEDTDVGGIVYHANYLKFAERARTELLRELGFNRSQLMKERDNLFVVRSCVLNCLAPARLDDVLEVRTRLKKMGYAKFDLSQTIFCEDKLIATVDVVLACVNSKGKPVKLNDALRCMFMKLEKKE